MIKKILLIQNQDNLRRVMGAFFARNFEVVGAKSGLEAMSLLGRGYMPDVIIADASITDLSSAQLVANLRYSGMFGHIPVILVGDTADEQERSNLRQLGVLGFFGKTFDPIKLGDQVRQATRVSTDYLWAQATAA